MTQQKTQDGQAEAQDDEQTQKPFLVRAKGEARHQEIELESDVDGNVSVKSHHEAAREFRATKEVVANIAMEHAHPNHPGTRNRNAPAEIMKDTPLEPVEPENWTVVIQGDEATRHDWRHVAKIAADAPPTGTTEAALAWLAEQDRYVGAAGAYVARAEFGELVEDDVAGSDWIRNTGAFVMVNEGELEEFERVDERTPP
jgi:hypothetical protein